MPRRPLRFGLMAPGTTLRAWQAACIRSLLAEAGVELAVLIVDATDRSTSRAERLRKHAGFTIYNRFFFHPTALAPTDLSATFAAVPRVACTVRREGFSEYFSPADLDAIRTHDLDFVLRFGFGIIRGEILDVPRYGVWSFHHGDEARYRGTPPGFWEVSRQDPVSGAILQRLVAEPSLLFGSQP